MSVLTVDSTPVPASAGFGVSFVDVDGSRRREPLSSCWMVPFERVPPARAFGSPHPEKKNFSGLWWLATTAEHVGFESWLERDNVMALDHDADVSGLSSQPFRLWWEQDGKKRNHTPDYFARLRDGTGVVIDVRADDDIEPKDAEAFAVTGEACRSVGWAYQRVGAVDPVLAANLRWLSDYKHPRTLNPGHASLLTRAFAQPAPLMDGAESAGDPIAVLPSLFHMLWSGSLRAGLTAAPLSGSTLVTAGGEDR